MSAELCKINRTEYTMDQARSGEMDGVGVERSNRWERFLNGGSGMKWRGSKNLRISGTLRPWEQQSGFWFDGHGGAVNMECLVRVEHQMWGKFRQVPVQESFRLSWMKS